MINSPFVAANVWILFNVTKIFHFFFYNETI